MDTNPTKNSEKVSLDSAAGDVLTAVLEAVVNTNRFNCVVDDYGERWSQTLTVAAFNPDAAIDDLRRDLILFFEQMEITTEMVIEWILDAVVSSPEFRYCERNVPVDEDDMLDPKLQEDVE